MRFREFLNDKAGRIMTLSAAFIAFGGALGSIIAPAPATLAVVSGMTAMAATIGTFGLVRATEVAPRWALASVFAIAYPVPVLFLIELLAIEYGWAVEYILLPAGLFLLWFAAAHGRSHAVRATGGGGEAAHRPV